MAMNCPGCRQTMQRLKVRNTELDQCGNCLGVWFDDLELDELFALQKVPERFLSMQRYRKEPEMVKEGQRECPCCGKLLLIIDVDGVSLDACKHCYGFFADIGEVRQLMLVSEERARRS